jgi:hypothetical protein
VHETRIALAVLLCAFAAIAFAFVESYPIVLNSINATVFAQLHPLFWMGLTAALCALFFISKSTKRKEIGWACAVIFFFLVWADYLFFPLIPGSDSHYFRGLTSVFEFGGGQRYYFQWPAFFILNSIVGQIVAIPIDVVSKYIFVMGGLVIASALFVLFSKNGVSHGFFATVLYVLGSYSYVNYQFAPQSLALGLLFLALVLSERKEFGATVAVFVLFVALILIHAFMVVFLLFLFLGMSIRNRHYWVIFFFGSVVYIVYLTQYSVGQFYVVLEYLATDTFLMTPARVLRASLAGPVSDIDAFAQTVGRGVILSVWAVISFCFLVELKRRCVDARRFSLVAGGLSYLAAGNFLAILGERAIQVVLVPLADSYRVFLRRFRTVAGAYVLLVLVLSPFIIVHHTYVVGNFQTVSGEAAVDMLVAALNPHSGTRLLADNEDAGYAKALLPENQSFSTRGTLLWGPTVSEVESLRSAVDHSRDNYDFIVHNVMFDKQLLQSGMTETDVNRWNGGRLSYFNLIYCDGYTSVFQNGLTR